MQGVEIRTLDSFAWRLRTGFLEQTTKSGDWNETISIVLGMLEHPTPEVQEYLDGFDHVFVDEAQDLVGDRALLVFRLLTWKENRFGWTVFLDPAQAIYGWADDSARSGDSASLLDLSSKFDKSVLRMKLTTLHRTKDPVLVNLLARARKAVTNPRSTNHLAKIRKLLIGVSAGRSKPSDIIGLVDEFKEESPPRTLFLFRTRAEVLWNSGFLATRGLEHRLRLSSMPHVVAPWIAIVCNSIGAPEFNISAFKKAWASLAGRHLTKDWDEDAAWTTLRKLGGVQGQKSLVSVSTIANRLAMSNLPDELSMKELGPGGPILSTIHASKGREAFRAIACIPNPLSRDDGTDGVEDEDLEQQASEDEEARVLYVAASRAREVLVAREAGTPRWGAGPEGRVWTKVRAGHVRMEFGRAGDLDPVSVLTAPANAENIQKMLAAHDGKLKNVGIRSRSSESGWLKELVLEPPKPGDAIRESIVLGRPTKEFEDSSLAIARRAWGARAHTPPRIDHLWWVDLTTVAIHAENPATESLPLPWRKTRLWLAPVIVGLGMAYYQNPGSGKS